MPVGTAEHHLRLNPILFMLLKVSKMLHDMEVGGDGFDWYIFAICIWRVYHMIMYGHTIRLCGYEYPFSYKWACISNLEIRCIYRVYELVMGVYSST